MIDIGVVKSVHAVDKKTIVGVSLRVDLNQVPLTAASICFGSLALANKLAGHKWWPDIEEIDLLFDSLKSPPEIGAATFVVE